MKLDNFSSADLRDAMQQLGKYYGLKDRNTFMQILLSSTAGQEQGNGDHGGIGTEEISAGNKSINTELKKLSEAVLSLTGEGYFMTDLHEVIKGFVGNPGADGNNDALAETFASNAHSPISLTLPDEPSDPNSDDEGWWRDRSVEDILEIPGTLNDTDGFISVCEVHHPNLNFSNRDTIASSIMLSAIPTLEISKAVPYFDCKVVSKSAPLQDTEDNKDDDMVFGNGMSIYKFLHGEKVEQSDTTIRQLVAALPMQFLEPDPSIDGIAGEKPSKTTSAFGGTVAGMELFTSPQTMVDGTLEYIDLDASNLNYGENNDVQSIPAENKVLDKFRPLMTFQSFNVQVTPATGMLATKAAEVTLILHDRTRMQEIAPMIQPAQLADTEFLIEWGWSHPQPDPRENPYGAMINAIRLKEKYGLMNSSYQFTPTGEVEITLKLFTKGAQRATFDLVSNGPGNKHPMDLMKELIKAIRSAMKGLKQEGYTLSTEMGAPDVLGKASSGKGLMTLTKKERKQISEFIYKMKKSSSKSASDNWKELSDSWKEATGAVDDYQAAVMKQFKASINLCTKSGKKMMVDPFLLPMKHKPYVRIGYSTHVSLANVLLEFVAKPLWNTKRFDDIQLVFYPMNQFAMFAKDLNVGQYPINKVEFKSAITEALKERPSMTIQKFLGFIRKMFVNNLADDIYGLSNYYSKNEEGKQELNKEHTKNEEAKQKFQKTKIKIMSKAYPEAGAEKRFKKPNITMWVECVPKKDDKKKTILRLHFFDKACTSYSSYSQMWQAASGSDLGIVGKTSSAQKQVEHAKRDEPDPKDKKRYEKWEAKVKKRMEKVNHHSQVALDQMNTFIETGLIEEFEVTMKVPDPKDNTKTIEEKVTKYRIKGGPDQLRGILAANMPTIKYGTEYSGVLSAQLNTMSDPAMETIHMQRANSATEPTAAQDNGLPMQIKPVELNIDTFGCPFLNFGQQFFVDFQTNTSIDDIYAISGVQHTMEPGGFTTSIKMSPLNKMGQFRAMTDQFADAMAVIDATADHIDPNPGPGAGPQGS
tara:strand:+ start:29 stop:3145 length:3117 start_codon:yes stop_codon:yes gene_type:complete